METVIAALAAVPVGESGTRVYIALLCLAAAALCVVVYLRSTRRR